MPISNPLPLLLRALCPETPGCIPPTIPPQFKRDIKRRAKRSPIQKQRLFNYNQLPDVPDRRRRVPGACIRPQFFGHRLRDRTSHRQRAVDEQRLIGDRNTGQRTHHGRRALPCVLFRAERQSAFTLGPAGERDRCDRPCRGLRAVQAHRGDRRELFRHLRLSGVPLLRPAVPVCMLVHHPDQCGGDIRTPVPSRDQPADGRPGEPLATGGRCREHDDAHRTQLQERRGPDKPQEHHAPSGDNPVHQPAREEPSDNRDKRRQGRKLCPIASSGPDPHTRDLRCDIRFRPRHRHRHRRRGGGGAGEGQLRRRPLVADA